MMEQGPFQRPPRRLLADMNVVPYIDVMLVLVVIFMVTAPMLTEGLKVELPDASAEALNVNDEQPVIITVRRSGDYWLKQGDTADKPMSRELLLQTLQDIASREPHKQILLNGDRHVDYGQVVQLMATLQQAGLTQVGLLTETPEP